MIRHVRAGLGLGLLVFLWGLCGLLVESVGLVHDHGPWSRELFDAVAWAVVWTTGGICYSAMRARVATGGWRGSLGPAALGGAAAGALLALMGVAVNIWDTDGLTAPALVERAAAVIVMGAISGVLVLAAAHVLRIAFAPSMPPNDRRS